MTALCGRHIANALEKAVAFSSDASVTGARIVR